MDEPGHKEGCLFQGMESNSHAGAARPDGAGRAAGAARRGMP